MSYVGIDISKSWFDGYCLQRGQVRRFTNDEEGWTAFAGWVGHQTHWVMEASGPYYLQGACWACQQGISVSVLNPLIIRRYAQMRLTRAKTDAKDARLIAEYARDHSPEVWQAPSVALQSMRQLMSLREGLLRQRTMLLGQQEAFSHGSAGEPLVEQIIADQLSAIKGSLLQIDRQLETLVEQHYSQTYQALQSIPGIGRKTALLLIAMTDGMRRFDNARKLASYVGICPRIYRSGSSIEGRGAICKLGSAQLRKLLYMCSWTAKYCNPACAMLYERMKQKGKPERVIKVAIAHKLLRQAFAVAKNGRHFDAKLAVAA